MSSMTLNFRISARHIMALVVLLFTTQAFSQLTNSVPRMVKEQSLNIFTGREMAQATLIANDPNEPELITTQKKTLQVISPKQLNAANNEFLNVILQISESTNSLATNLENYYIIDYFAHGFEKMKVQSDLNQKQELLDKAKYWVALIPKNTTVTQTLVQLEWFKEGVGGHGQIRYKLSDELILIRRELLSNLNQKNISKIQIKDFSKQSSLWQDRFLTASPIVKIPGDVTFTLMATRTVGGPTAWGPVSGLTGAFANALTLNSTDHIAVMQVQDNYVEQVELSNTESNETVRQQAQASFEYAINYSNQVQETHIYHLIFNSCITAAMKILNADNQGFQNLNLFSFNPYTFIDEFKKNKTNNKTSSLNLEYGSKLTKRYVNPQVAPYLETVKNQNFDSFIQQFAYKNLDLTYLEMHHLIQFSGLILQKIKSKQIKILPIEDFKITLALEADNYLKSQNIQLSYEQKLKLNRKAQELFELLGDNLDFLYPIVMNLLKTQN